jgi:uncharacterized protein YeaO (DUF488 family)
VGDVRIARVYDEDRPSSGQVFLVDRVWPRGVAKGDLRLDGWLRDVAPSTALRTWFGHDVARWAEFRRRYVAELEAAPQTWQALLDAVRGGDVTLLYGARDREHNQAVVLRDFLLARR